MQAVPLVTTAFIFYTGTGGGVKIDGTSACMFAIPLYCNPYTTTQAEITRSSKRGSGKPGKGAAPAAIYSYMGCCKLDLPHDTVAERARRLFYCIIW
jgi:hypothetical protein